MMLSTCQQRPRHAKAAGLVIFMQSRVRDGLVISAKSGDAHGCPVTEEARLVQPVRAFFHNDQEVKISVSSVSSPPYPPPPPLQPPPPRTASSGVVFFGQSFFLRRETFVSAPSGLVVNSIRGSRLRHRRWAFQPESQPTDLPRKLVTQ